MRLKELVLEKIAELGEVTLDSFFPRNYPEARLWRSLLGLDRQYQFSRRSFSAILSQLRRGGLVERRSRGRGATWRLTPREQSQRAAARQDTIQRLVVFDIPEKERHKRDAIRIELMAAGYSQLQKSVWVGQRPIPDDFLELLDALHLHDHVHIFSVRDPGTLRSRT